MNMKYHYQEFLEKMQSDLKTERVHMMMYAHFAAIVSGKDRTIYKSFFEKEAKEELGHALAFQEMIAFLGGVPNTVYEITFQNDYEDVLKTNDTQKILRAVASMEKAVANTYAERIEELENLITTDVKGEKSSLIAIKVFYEHQLEDSWRGYKSIILELENEQ